MYVRPINIGARQELRTYDLERKFGFTQTEFTKHV